MIVEEYKSGSTIIKIDDRDICTKEENTEIVDLIYNLSIKKILEYLKK